MPTIQHLRDKAQLSAQQRTGEILWAALCQYECLDCNYWKAPHVYDEQVKRKTELKRQLRAMERKYGVCRDINVAGWTYLNACDRTNGVYQAYSSALTRLSNDMAWLTPCPKCRRLWNPTNRVKYGVPRKPPCSRLLLTPET